MKTLTLLATLLLSTTQILALVLDSPIINGSPTIQSPLVDTETETTISNVAVDIPLRCNEARCNTCRAKNHCGPGRTWSDFSPLLWQDNETNDDV
jgi:hypothetical protein